MNINALPRVREIEGQEGRKRTELKARVPFNNDYCGQMVRIYASCDNECPLERNRSH